MRDKITRLLHSAVGVLAWGIFGVLLALLLHIILLFANYSGLIQAFEILGTDQKPMADDALLGWLFDTLPVGDTTQAHLLAATLVVAFAVGFWFFLYCIFNIIKLAGLRARSMAQGDTDSAKEAMFRILYDESPYLFLTSIPLGVVACWDLWLFRFRATAGSLGIELPEEALESNILTPTLDSVLVQGSDSLVFMLDMFGGWGYLAAAFLSALFLKFTWIKLKESVVILEDSLLDMLNIENQPEDELVAADIPARSESATEQRNTLHTHAESQVADPAIAEQTRGPEPETETGVVEKNVNTTPDMPLDVATGPDELVTVVGENEQVRISEIMANPERYFRHEDGRWWNRGYYESLHANESNEKEAA